MVTITRKQLVGSSTKKSAVVEAVARSNTRNLTGRINYNSGGMKDNIGFVGVSEMFIDNFLLRILVPEYNITNGKMNPFVGSQNTKIRELLKMHGLNKCNVKAITFSRLRDDVSAKHLEKTPDLKSEYQNVVYYAQDFKIATPNLDYDLVMDFIRSSCYNDYGYFLKDIDVTLDFAGSFDKNEIVSYLVVEKGFRLQGTEDFAATRTIVDNDCMVGRNCMTFMEDVDGIIVRQKVYNKMVQSLECKSIRSSIGSHLKDWVCQKNTRLAEARDRATNRGLTRTEATFYLTENNIPSDDFIENVLNRIARYIPLNLVYSTPFKAVWDVYCSSMEHSLVCIDRVQNIGLIVHTYNELTRNISGHLHEKWSDKEKWCLEKLTLNGKLPLDIIDVNLLNRSLSSGTDSKGKKIRRCEDTLEITGTTFTKINTDSSLLFSTRLVSKNGCYSFNKGSKEENAALLEKAGLLPHENCVPFLATNLANTKSKANAEFRTIEELEITIEPLRATLSSDDLKERLEGVAKRIDAIRRPLLEEIGEKERLLTMINKYCKKFSTRDDFHLRDLELGQYTIVAARKQPNKYGEQYRLLLEIGDESKLVWGNFAIKEFFDALPTDQIDKLRDDSTGFLAMYDKPLGVLTITGRGTNIFRKTTVYCCVKLADTSGSEPINKLKSTTKTIIQQTEQKISTTEEDIYPVKLVSRENLLNYTDYNDLASLVIGSVVKVNEVGYITYYGIDRLILHTDKGWLLGGDDLEGKIGQIKQDSQIKIRCTRLNKSRRKYAVCDIYDKGDWTAFVDYPKTPMLTDFNGKNLVVDVKTVQHKGQKRKLLMTDRGIVYRMKKCKLENVIKPGLY